jgi:hypothetical protein
MRHPFELEISDLEAVNFNIEEELTGEEAIQVTGGLVLITQALGEEGGRIWPPIIKPPIKPPIFTTMALGEEGGSSLL